jgi:hypothetical protein
MTGSGLTEVGRERLEELLPTLQESLGSVDVRRFIGKVNEQKRIVKEQDDLRALKQALSAFTSLQHVQILRVLDYEDAELIKTLRHHDRLGQLVQLNWVPACSHGTKTLGAALIESGSPCSRFSSPMLSPQSAAALVTEQGGDSDPATGSALTAGAHDLHGPNGNGELPSVPAPRFPKVVGTLASRLTCLELHFDDSGGMDDLDTKMRSLSGLFKAVFSAAQNMQALHVGFPSHRPLSLPLEELFHGVHFEKLLAFGIQAWKLDADEIVAIARRHSDRLKGLRLRDVLLKDGSMWKDVLLALKRQMHRLEWVSLRRIGYAHFFDEQWAVAGAEVPDDPPGGDSESDSEEDDDPLPDEPEDDEDLWDHTVNHNHETNGAGSSGTNEDDMDDYATSSASSSPRSLPDRAAEEGIDFPPLSPDTPSSTPWCTCSTRNPAQRHHRCCCYDDERSADELGDDGIMVSNVQRKMWEKWVLRKCGGYCCARK